MRHISNIASSFKRKLQRNRITSKSSLGSSVGTIFSIFLLLISITFHSSATAETLITNTATANYSINGIDKNKSSSVQFTTDNIVVATGITLQKKSNISRAIVGQIIDYSLIVTNNANAIQANLSIEDLLPTGLEYQQASAKLNNSSINTSDISLNDNDITFSLGDMPANAVWTITYKAKVTTTAPLGSAINQAIASSDTTESSPAQATVTIYEQVIVVPVIPTVPLEIEKKANINTAKVGDSIVYAINIKNPNSKNIPSVTLTDILPVGLAYKVGSATLNNNAITADTSEGLHFNLGSMSSNSEWTVTYETTVTDEVTSRDLENSVTATSSDTDANSNTSKALVTVVNDSIQITKTSSEENVYVGDIVTYDVVVRNPALHDLSNLIVKDTLPNGFIYQSNSFTLDGQALSDSEISYSGNNLSINVDSLAIGSTMTLSYKVLISDASESGDVVNQVQANSTFGTSDIATASVKVRTPSTINFLKINEAGNIENIPSSAYNADQNGGKNWQAISQITLPNGTVISLPNPQPIIDAKDYSVSEPVIIEVIDKDQNVDPDKLETIIVTVTIPGTNDTEILLLTETSTDSGIFRGAVLTTAASTQKQNGVLTIADGVKISVSYLDQDDKTDTSATAALVVPDTKLSLSKTVDKSSASIGELVKYTLDFQNTTGFNLSNIKVNDLLPLGFRYVSNTAYLNGEKITEGVSANGRKLLFSVNNLTAGSTATIEYITKITAGVQTGKATNTAVLSSGGLTSNTAYASIEIDDDLMRIKNILTGRVYIGCDTHSSKNKYVPKVLKDARIYLETGRSVLTDKDGFWHMEGVLPGSHVLQLDTDSLPKGYTPLLCEDNTRHAGDAKSQFVDLTAGSLWQVNFHVKEGLDAKESTEVGSPVSPKAKKKGANPITLFGANYLKSAEPGFEILWPRNNHVPDVASIKVFIKSSPQEKIEVFLNGKKISALNYDGSDSNKARTVKISRWLGIDIDTRIKNNALLVIAKDKSGKVVAKESRNIHFSGIPASAEYLPEESILVADGKTTPVIALRIKDEDGYPMRANTHGYLTLDNSNYQIKTLNEADQDRLNINESLSGSYKYIVEEDGIARVELNPTTQSGEVRFTVNFTESQSKTISAWLKPQLRDWILVGIAEGTLAHKTITGNMQTLDSLGKSDEFYKRGRFAFFAKGQIKGKYLLTAAYDSHKAENEVGSQLAGNIDPDEWYSIYADNSSSQYDAPSSRKLYLKIEKDNFYALFGDYQTAMTVTELASYERVLNGIKTEYRGQRFNVKGFISETSNNHQQDEIQGDGTSGLYRLSENIIPNSESIKIETRDRFHSDRIVETKQLTRYQDYSIDYDAGTLFFKSPIASRDSNFNPNIIVIDYDSEEDTNKTIVAGGRASMKSFNDKLETGASIIYEENTNGKADQLVAADATYNITKDTKLHIEVAESKTTESDFEKRQAMIIELEKEVEQMEARLYAKKHDEDFGISSQTSESGTEKIGAEVTYRLNDKTRLTSQLLYENNIENDNKRKLAQVGIEHRYKNIELNAGLRHTQENLGSSDVSDDITTTSDVSTHEKITTNTIILGGRYTTKNDKITLRTDLEKNFSSDDGSELSPDRFVVGVDVKLQQGFTVFAENETTDNGIVTTHNNRVGVYKDLWKDAKGKTTYTQERTAEGQRNYATLGLSQKLKLTDKISADFSIDRAVTVGDQKFFNTDETTIQGTDSDDYTAFSVGLGANEEVWSWTSRAEYRNGKVYDKVNLLASVIRHLDDGKHLSAKFSYYDQDSTEGDAEQNIKLSLGSAWHPKDESFVFFSRLDLISEKENSIDESSEFSSSDTDTRKIVHNMHFNKILNKDAKRKLQFSIHHGIKHVKDENSGVKYSTTVDTATVELRKDINKRWDIGAHAGYLHDWKSNTMETVAGVSVGVTPAKNTWIEAGYNFEGFDDEDFDESNFKRKGPYVDFRYKFNQDSLNLNKPRSHRKDEKQADQKANKEIMLEAE
ncbi:hypothetical protein OO007_18355 [Cocleimonas sp. KMM 6892]|uniref:DUF11 domain-containing protein n=1 Tax=unclassified Cocleimonas TaxID=2639732 RepID=UPI002DB6B8EC|nr:MULTISPECIES: hypothetical protein [unclassified Cocleimonas]MEB8434205.1 hypothetical protein [Cocleimonas sp. KMM 6892]MEC4717176.1 hypothetical protein [Cocleimonas sp. KMM 6895]MEC4746477.1 hypothetical protein [Cocleimonas sp. KMM 6896]